MKFKRMPLMMGSGCIALLLSTSTAWAQTGGMNPQSSTPQAGASQTGASQTGGMRQQPGADAQMGPGMQSGNMDNGASMSDKSFVKTAMQGGMAEVKLGQLAAQKASSDDVKQFGQKMVDDHTKLNNQMKPVASQLGVNPPADVSAKDKALQKKLEAMNGADFDKAYMKAMVADHKKDLSDFKKEAASGKAPAVKDAAQQGSQVIAEHLQMAQQVAQKVGAMGGGSNMGAMSK